MPVNSSTLPAPPLQPSWRIRAIAAVALDAQEPGREGPEWLVQRFLGGRQRLGAVAAPVALRRRGETTHGRSFPAICSYSGVTVVGSARTSSRPLSLSRNQPRHVALHVVAWRRDPGRNWAPDRYPLLS